MSDTVSARLEALGVEIPDVAAPAANYLPYTKTGKFVFTSGQLPIVDGALKYTGKVGGELSVEQGQEAARLCVVNVLAVAKAALGDLENIKQIVKITIFVSSTPDFTSQHLVGNGASDFLVEVLGEPGRHARSAVGMPCLPLDAPVEVEAIIEAK